MRNHSFDLGLGGAASALMTCLLASSPASAVTLTSNPASLTLAYGSSSNITFTFANTEGRAIYINHIKAYRETSSTSCGGACIQQFAFEDSTSRHMDTATNYVYTLPVIAAASPPAKPPKTTVSTVLSTIWWEYDYRGRGHVQYKIQDRVNVDATGAVLSSSVTAATVGPSSVPEPSSWALMIIGIGGIAATLRGRRVAARA
jgi:hypothetical protein